MKHPLELNLVKAESFGPMKMLKRFHTNWINQNGTSFTNIPTDQKLAEILEGKWINGLSHNFVEGVYMDRRRPRKIGSHRWSKIKYTGFTI